MIEREELLIQNGTYTVKEMIKQKESDLKNYKARYINLNESLLIYQKTIEFNSRIETSEPYLKRCNIFEYVPKNLHLKDCNDITKRELNKFAHRIDDVGIQNLHEGSLAKIQVIQNRFWSATHQHSKISPEEIKKAVDDYKKLEELIKIFLNTSLGTTIDDEATLFGFPLGQSQLSDGQKILLQFCLAIYSQSTKLSDLILFLDEPENHLHPSVLTEVFDRIRSCITNGQIWIATHSIPLLAHFDPSLIWYTRKSIKRIVRERR